VHAGEKKITAKVEFNNNIRLVLNSDKHTGRVTHMQKPEEDAEQL